jgi:hypothetical protein
VCPQGRGIVPQHQRDIHQHGSDWHGLHPIQEAHIMAENTNNMTEYDLSSDLEIDPDEYLRIMRRINGDEGTDGVSAFNSSI